MGSSNYYTWPKWMPYPLQAGFSMQPEDRRIAQSTIGTSFQKGFGGDVCIAEVSLRLTREQARWFDSLERDSTVQGTIWFELPIWYAGEVHFEQCRFKTRPKFTTFNGFHEDVSFSVYVRKRSELLPSCMIKLFSCWPPCFFFEFNSILIRLLSKLSNVTRAKVNSALAEIYEE